MSLGNVLIRPQVLNRRAINDDAQLMDLLTGLATRLLEDFLRHGAASRKIVQAVEKTQVDFVKPFIPRLETVRTKLMRIIKPYLDTIETVKNPSTDLEGLKEIIELAFTLANKLLDDVHTQQISTRLNDLLDILENDLGVSRAGFENFFLRCLDNIETELSNDFLHGNQNEDSLNNFLLSIQIRSARRQVRALLALVPLPELNIRTSIRQLALELTNKGWDEQLDKLKKSLDDAKQKLPDLMQTLSGTFGLSTARSLMSRDLAAPCEYAWYASWFTGDTVILPDRFEITATESDAELATKLRINAISLRFLEHWAHFGYVALQILGTIGNGRNIENGNLWSPLLNAINRGSDAIFSFITIFMKSPAWAEFMTVKRDGLDTGLFVGLTLAGSLEKVKYGWGWLFATLPNDFSQAGDAKAFELPDELSFLEPETLYELSLTIFTLINADNTEGGENQDNHGAIRDICKEFMGEYVSKRLIEGHRYHALFDDIGSTVVTYLAGAATMWAADIVGWLVAGAFSRKLAVDGYWGGKDFGSRFIKGENAYGAILHAFKDFHGIFDLEGDTEGGKYGLKKQLVDDAITFQKIEFQGFAPRATSPYLLPFDDKRTVFCSQTHRGRSSHNNYTGLIYAVDFLVKRDEPVLAMRKGTVVDYVDHNAMTENGFLDRLERVFKTVTFQGQRADDTLNYIVVQHDDINNEHDKNELGQPTTTYAYYENSEPFAIRRAFAARGITPDCIIGSRIEQGTPIMFLGKRTGITAFNHLQVYVGAASNEAILPTIPFVFQDIDDKGVPEKGKYYRSGNVAKVPLSISLFHPEKSEGLVVESGRDYLILEQNANENDGFYTDAHIFLTFDAPEGGVAYEYRKIKNYSGDDRKITIEGAWSFGESLPEGTHYSIGSKPFRSNTEFDQQFAYIANRNAATGEIEKLGGTTLPTPFMKRGVYQNPIATGKITDGGQFKGREVMLDDNASIVQTDYRRQHIAILRGGQLIQYQLIEDYKIEVGIKTITIAGQWEMDLITTGDADTYQIGAVPYAQTDAAKAQAFLAPDVLPSLHTPTDLSDKTKPYVYGGHQC